MICSRCSTALAPGSLFCPKCGMAFSEPVPPATAPRAAAAGPMSVLSAPGAAGTSAGVFIGIMMAFIVICILGFIINSVNQQAAQDREIDATCGRLTAQSGQSMDACRQQIKNMGK